MPKYLHLQIPTPCHEDWNKMTPESQGRFCGSCQKTVTDFTNMSDAQLIAFFKNPKPSVCGRFNGEQLERDILIPRKRIPWVKYFFQFALPAFLLSLKSSAQMGKVSAIPPAQKVAVQKLSKFSADTTIVEKPNAGSPLNALQGIAGGVISTVEIRTGIDGIITDPDGKPLPFTTITLKGTSQATIADSSGQFVFQNVLLPSTLMVSCLGFAPQEFRVESFKEQLNIRLQPQLLGEVVVVGAISPRKKIKVKETRVKTAITPALTIYPNPARSSSLLHLKWQNPDAGNYRIEIYNTGGALMKSKKLVLEKGLSATSITINELFAGNYFARLINEKTGKQLSQQFIVQE
jgi:hypothetical protein